MRRNSDTLRENRWYEPISDEKGFPRGKTQNEIGEAIEASAFVPREAWRALSTRANNFYLSPHISKYKFAKKSP